MFTGIVQGLGRILEMKSKGGEFTLAVRPEFDWDGPLSPGESICVSGACLTVTDIRGPVFSAHVSGETVSRTIMKEFASGSRVNLERALRLQDRLGGHLVTGHVDGVGTIKERAQRDRSIVFTIGLPADLSRLVVEKGSIAVDGVSLTVNEVRTDSFSINIIPHTALATTIGFKNRGDCVNLETDLIGKYVAKFVGRGRNESAIDEKFLAEHGFL